MIYFVAGGGRIKIGYTKNVKQRLATLSGMHSHPLEVIGTMEGDAPLERGIHRAFQEHHERKEWFTDCVELRAKIARLIADGPDAFDIKPIVPEPKPAFVPSPPDPMAFPKLCRLVWGDDVKEELAALGEVSIETARGWLSDPATTPRLVRMAFCVVLFGFIYGYPYESFQEKEAA